MSRGCPSVSVIVTVYNCECYIEACLQSLLQQTLLNFELLVIDDASTDQSWVICQQLAQYDARIKLFRMGTNSGPGMARNRGLQEATGRFLTFVDGDDMVEPEYLKTLYQQAIRQRADVVSGGSKNYCQQEDGTYLLEEVPRMTETVWTLSENPVQRIELMLKNSTSVSSWGNIYNREFIEKNHLRFDDMPNFEDCLFNFLCLYYAEKYVYIGESHYRYFVRKTSLSRGRELAKVRQFWQSGIKTLLASERWMQEMELFQQNPALKLRIKAYFFGIFLRHILPFSRLFSQEEINGEIHAISEDYFKEQRDFVMLLLDYCLLQERNLMDGEK